MPAGSNAASTRAHRVTGLVRGTAGAGRDEDVRVDGHLALGQDLRQRVGERFHRHAQQRRSTAAVRRGELLIFITAKFAVKPEHADDWPRISRAFTEATRAEPGCLWFDWSRSIEDPNEYVLVEAFRDGAAGSEHVQSEHFKQAQAELPQHLQSTPKIVHFEVEQSGWSELGELAVRD